MSTSPDSVDRDGLRELIRQVLADVMPEGASAVPAPAVDPGGSEDASGIPSGATTTGQSVEEVSLRSDVELHTFVLRLLTMFENPKLRDDLRSGRRRFALTPGSQPGRIAPSRRIDKGAVTESQVKDAATVGARLVLGRRAVVTPLARDKARALGVVIEREA